MKTKNKKIVVSKSELLTSWLGEMCRRGYCENYIGFATVDFYEAIDTLDTSAEFIFEDEE